MIAIVMPSAFMLNVVAPLSWIILRVYLNLKSHSLSGCVSTTDFSSVQLKIYEKQTLLRLLKQCCLNKLFNTLRTPTILKKKLDGVFLLNLMKLSKSDLDHTPFICFIKMVPIKKSLYLMLHIYYYLRIFTKKKLIQIKLISLV